MNNGYSNGPPRPGFQPYRSRLPHHPPAPSQAPVASTSAAAASTSHHRPEDAQPNESVAFHRPQAPPQIAVVPPPPPPLAPFPRPPQQNSSARGRGRGALVGGGRGRGTGSNASIFMPRKGAGRGSVAGSWAPSSRPGGASASSAFPAPPQGPSGLSTSKGKEKEVAPSLPSRPAFPMSVPAPPSAPSRPAKASSAPTFYGVPKGPRASYPPATAVSVPQNAAYVPRAPVQPAGTSARLFISSIPNGATADELRYIFAPYGTMYVKCTFSTVLCFLQADIDSPSLQHGRQDQQRDRAFTKQHTFRPTFRSHVCPRLLLFLRRSWYRSRYARQLDLPRFQRQWLKLETNQSQVCGRESSPAHRQSQITSTTFLSPSPTSFPFVSCRHFRNSCRANRRSPSTVASRPLRSRDSNTGTGTAKEGGRSTS